MMVKEIIKLPWQKWGRVDLAELGGSRENRKILRDSQKYLQWGRCLFGKTFQKVSKACVCINYLYVRISGVLEMSGGAQTI